MVSADLPTNALAACAKLLVFAECYHVTALKQLALFKLHRDLCVFNLEPGNAMNFVDTIDFVCNTTAVFGKKEDLT